MRERLPSTTAAIVAAARSAAGVDPIAQRLLPFGFGIARMLPLVDLMRVRTLAIDERVERAAAKQVVILGAGLCARAWRMPALADAVVYEIDHPATQRYKRSRLAHLPLMAKDVRFVAVDFEKDDLARRLAEERHEDATPTTWIWEGVTPYLTKAAVSATLVHVRARSARGSTLLVTYGTPPERLAQKVLHRSAAPFLRVFGEPFLGLVATEEMHRRVEDHGFHVEEDVDYMNLAQRMRIRAPRGVIAERLLTARVVG